MILSVRLLEERIARRSGSKSVITRTSTHHQDNSRMPREGEVCSPRHPWSTHSRLDGRESRPERSDASSEDDEGDESPDTARPSEALQVTISLDAELLRRREHKTHNLLQQRVEEEREDEASHSGARKAV